MSAPRGVAGRRALALVVPLALVVALAPERAAALSAETALRAEARGLAELVSLQRRLTDAELALSDAIRDESELGETLARAEKLLAERRRSLERARQVVRVRLRALSRGGRRGLLADLLDARHLSDFRKRRRAMARALRADAARIKAYADELRRVEALTREIAAQKARVANVRARVQSRRDALASLRAERERALESLRSKGVPAALARTRSRLRARLSSLVASLRAELHAARSPRRLRGRLPHPVDGPITVPFGPVREPPFGAVTLHAGWRYRAKVGTAVRAIFSGRVVYARSLAGYGNLVIVDHGGQVHSLSAHLSSIGVREGQRVSAGQALGAVGGEGTLRGAGLYFELRLRGRPQDPARWMTPRRADGFAAPRRASLR